VIGREYRSWTFADRSFAFAFTFSVLWHVFWFLSVDIKVASSAAKRPKDMKLVSLGPVLDDELIKTLVESRPEYSRAFYRELSDLEKAVDIPPQTLGRQESGEVSSLPFGEKTVSRLRDIVGGVKAAPDFFQGGTGLSASDYFRLEGDVDASQILSRPEPPEINDVRFVTVEFEVDSAGRVASTAIAESTGDAELDARWEDHLRQWLFAPAPALGGGNQKAKAVFRRSTAAP
jgi:TonB family protein